MASERLSTVVRRKFIDFFTTKHNHKFVPSSPVLPKDDHTTCFVNAGMHQFKSLFLADQSLYEFPRVCNYQKCIRVGGKMCDLDQIGHDHRHHTFFEMLGNWSFNDYGKYEACEWALDFLVNQLSLDEKRLSVTYYGTDQEQDLETRDIWLRLGMPSDRIHARGSEDNFWSSGSGPCGFSSEIFYELENGLPLEIWNLVFIDRKKVDDQDESNFVRLKSKFVDTGMGLERIVAIMQGVESNFDTDLFSGHFEAIKAKSNVEPYGGRLDSPLDVNYRQLADFSRMITVALSDGVEPGGRGSSFELRSLIKKSFVMSRDTFKQEVPKYLLFDLFDETIKTLSEPYPELLSNVKHIRRTVSEELKHWQNITKPRKTVDRHSTETIKRIFKSSPSQEVSRTVGGYIHNFRSYKKMHFIDLIDGTTNKQLQIIIDRTLMMKPTVGTYLVCEGFLTPSRGQLQEVEFKCNKIIHMGECDPAEYPIASIPDKSQNALRRILHLRPRTKNFASIMRVRSELEMSLHTIMKQMDFLRVHTPSITSNDSEASGDLFVLKRSKLERKCDENNGSSSDEVAKPDHQHEDDIDHDEVRDGLDSHKNRIEVDNYFNKDAYLTTSSQLHLECLAASLSRVYTLNPAFRAENSQTKRHLCEFLMFEAEEANVFEIDSLMDRVETIIKFAGQYLTNISEHRSDFEELLVSTNHTETLNKMLQSKFIRINYLTALKVLKHETNFSGPTQYGCDIGRDHELALLDHFENIPIFITKFPYKLKPFYMRSVGNHAQCFDLIAPIGGEICGGSLREHELDKLQRRILKLGGEKGLQDDRLRWYLDTRRFGTFAHGGFGLGFDRLLQSFLGINNIKDLTPFPRWPGRCEM